MARSVIAFLRWFGLLSFLLFVVFVVTEYLFPGLRQLFGIHPKSIPGLFGVVFAPLLHGSWSHLASNWVGLLLAGLTLWVFYRPLFGVVTFWGWIGTNALVWLLASSQDAYGHQTYHIGASGLVYTWVSFLISSGVFRYDLRSAVVGIVTLLLNEGFFWGLVDRPGISTESHLGGAVLGLVLAYAYRKAATMPPPKRYPWQDEPDDRDDPDIPSDWWDYRQRYRR